MLTILRTGLSVAELRELRVAHLKPSVETFTHLHIGAKVGHENKPRAIPVSKEFQGQLKTFLRWKRLRGEAVTPNSYLFVSARFTQASVRHLQRIVRESTLGAFGTPYRPRDLQLTFEACTLPQIPADTQILTPLEMD